MAYAAISPPRTAIAARTIIVIQRDILDFAPSADFSSRLISVTSAMLACASTPDFSTSSRNLSAASFANFARNSSRYLASGSYTS